MAKDPRSGREKVPGSEGYYAWTDPDKDKIIDKEQRDVDFKQLVLPQEVKTQTINIAGAIVPVFEKVEFKDVDYDLYITPFWIDKGIVYLREYISLLVEISVIRKRIEILKHELRITTQRVNLFEKVKIPECIENIRIIRICLGDQQANAVGISKVAKRKIELCK